ncbi:sensor histidine kinase [Paenibacillus radicis (ex Xue et al. 2023)]|uniref:histidine kinase n=1 Tax=Paenibacillus radicis (ex Xue et al. 2023) TaxID=2972489 RepID=A0ABT1Y9C0_9BACL|nr:HAMP domain-containing sensor histidine kinase [Paenibacillus radicis (ex Xue et al. 2023)]MCR8629784.1 HAMP domain-containing histidine kinase [Paenibacillus radicis (ex Xue et al. 2023)]
MDNESLLVKVRQMEHQFITHWINALSNESPGDANKEELFNRGQAYFRYITELHIPFDNHPVVLKAVDWARTVEKDEGTVKWIISFSHLWRNSLLEVGGDILSLGLFKQISARIDHFEIMMCHACWEKTVLWMKEKDCEFDRLHEDRINLIGKMASSMAHEIRNPLTSIIGFLKLVRLGIHQQTFEKVDSYLDIIEHECDNILKQVTGFLSFSKRPMIEEGLVYVSARQILDTNISLLSPRLIDENVDLLLAVPEQVKLRVQKSAIQQVLSNLLNNGIDALSALKSNKKMCISCSEDSGYIYIRVSNNGPSIPAEMAQRLFTPFVTNKEHGTGLGLAICKQIMAKNNGEISFTSDDSETAFLLTFPKKRKVTESGVQVVS